MIVVILCAARKARHAGHMRSPDGRKVLFVARPGAVPARSGFLYAQPDDLAGERKSWRTLLHEYNENPGDNPLGLLPAWQLYENPIYGRLKRHVGVENLYILSAGWGLISADFLTPNYDITFSTDAKYYNQRPRGETYRDISMLPDGNEEPIMFFGSKHYVDLFCALTKHTRGRRVLWYNSKYRPMANGCDVRRFHTTKDGIWYYECAQAFIDGKLSI